MQTIFIAAAAAAFCGVACAAAPAYGDWVPAVRIDKMTDSKECSIRNRKHPGLFFGDDNISISFAGRGGVDGYRYRLDAAPASEMRISSTDIERRWIIVPNYKNQLVDAKRLLISGLTILHTPIEENISLVGLKAARAKMLQDCGLRDEWANYADAPLPPPPENFFDKKQ